MAAITSSIPSPATFIPTIQAPQISPSSSLSILYRGATVEDLQLPPAVCVSLNSNLLTALTVANDHDYSQLPVLDDNDRKLKGYLDIRELKQKLEIGKVKGEDGIENCLKRFRGGKGKGGVEGSYTIIEPDTGLADLELFLRTQPFAFVTSPSRAFVLAVATREDLERYSLRRGLSIQRDGAKTPTNANNHTTNGVGASGAGVGGGVGATGNGMGMTRREEEEARKDRTLAEFLRLMDGYEPLIPDEVTSHYLSRSGFASSDPRLSRLLSLAAEKFVSDIASDAFQYARIRTAGAPVGRPSGNNSNNPADRSRTVLTMDDLSAALKEHGVGARRAEFYR